MIIIIIDVHFEQSVYIVYYSIIYFCVCVKIFNFIIRSTSMVYGDECAFPKWPRNL